MFPNQDLHNGRMPSAGLRSLRGTNHEPGHSRCLLATPVPKRPVERPAFISKYMRLWHQQSQTEGKQKPSWSLWGQFMAINFKNTRESSSPSGKLPFQRDVGKVGDWATNQWNIWKIVDNPLEVGQWGYCQTNYTPCAHMCFFNPMFMAGNYTILTIRSTT